MEENVEEFYADIIEEQEKEKAERSPVERWVSCCLTCDHWDGDRELQIKNIEGLGDIVMDKFKGWPEEGCCKIDYEWSSLEINGNATATFRVSSNFGCNYHSKPQNN